MNLEETILISVTIGFVVNIYLFMLLKLFTDWVEWKLECKNTLSLADPDCCMCGSMVEDHGYSDNHAAVSQYDWAINNKPKLKLGEW